MTCPSQIWKHSRQGNAFGTSIHSRAFNEEKTLWGYDLENIFGDVSILPNISNIHQSRENFWMKSDFHTSLDPTCISSWKLWYTKTPILKLFHEDPDISSLFSKVAFFLGKMICLNYLLKNSPKLSIKARAAVSFRYRNAFLIFTFEPIPSDNYHSTFFLVQVTFWKYYQSFEWTYMLSFWLPCTFKDLLKTS